MRPCVKSPQRRPNPCAAGLCPACLGLAFLPCQAATPSRYFYAPDSFLSAVGLGHALGGSAFARGAFSYRHPCLDLRPPRSSSFPKEAPHSASLVSAPQRFALASSAEVTLPSRPLPPEEPPVEGPLPPPARLRAARNFLVPPDQGAPGGRQLEDWAQLLLQTGPRGEVGPWPGRLLQPPSSLGPSPPWPPREKKGTSLPPGPSGRPLGMGRGRVGATRGERGCLFEWSRRSLETLLSHCPAPPAPPSGGSALAAACTLQPYYNLRA